jgi:hypothetical protein
MFVDTKGVIIICISKKNRQHNGQKKKIQRTNNDLHNARLCKLQKGCTRIAAASDISLLVAFQWLVVLSGDWVSSTTKTNCHDIAEILLKMALKTINQISHTLVYNSLHLSIQLYIALWNLQINDYH